MKKIHKKVMALLLAALMITSVMDTHVQAESSTEANNISVVNDGTGDAEEVSDVEKKDMEENKDETEKKEESDVEEADTEAVKEKVEGSADDEEKKDVDTYKSKNEVVGLAAKKAPTEVKSCNNSGMFSDILNFEFEDSAWMNAITAVSVNDDASYTKGTINSFSSGKLWEVGNTTGSYGSYKALKVMGFSSSDYPLTVKTSATGYEDIEIKVLGTQFNVQAYQDENTIETTLCEGSVNVSDGKQKVTLTPSLQAVYSKSTKNLITRKVDTRLYSSWKDGLFVFENKPLEEIMTTLSRWYNIHVFYANQAVKTYHFTGDLERYGDFRKTLGMIEKATSIRFVINGNNIMVEEVSN